MSEEWRPVVGFEGLYSVSDAGRIKSHPRLVERSTSAYTTKERFMRPARGVDQPYWTLRLTKDRVTVTRSVHHLVLMAFVAPMPEGMEGCHNDGDTANNAKSNLRWDTRSSNHADKNAHGTSPTGERHPQAKLTEEAVLALRKRRAAGASFAVLANEFGVTRMTAHRAATGTSWSHI